MAEAERTCPSCGRPVTATARICIGCGKPLPPVAPGPISAPEIVPGPIGQPPPAEASAAELAEQTMPIPTAGRGRRRKEPATASESPAPAAAFEPAAGPGVEPELDEGAGASSPPPLGMELEPVSGATSPPPGGMPPPVAMPPPGAVIAPSGVVPTGAQLQPPPQPPPPPPAPPFPLPDTSILRAVRRTAARSTVSAGIVAGVISAAITIAGAAIVALLWWAAHLPDNCSAQGAVPAGDCAATGVNGYLTNLTAVLWQSHGAGEVLGLSSGTDLTVRIPLGLGIVLVGGALYIAGRFTVRMLFLRSPADAALRSLVIAATHTTVMMVAGAALTARGDGLAIGPHYGLLLLWGLGLGFAASYAGILRRTFPQVPRRALVDRTTSMTGPAAPFLAAALTGIGLALALATLAGVLAMATHLDQTADAIRAVVAAMTTKPWPNAGLGTFAAIVLLVLAAPTWAAWVLAYSLVIPTVSSGGYGDFGLTVGDHDAYFWIVVLIPVVSTLLTGYAAARLRRAGSVESAVVCGAGAGLLWAVMLWILIALLDGVVSVGGRASGAAFSDLGFGPALGSTLGALLLWGLVGGVVGAYVALATVARPTNVPLLRRYSVAVVGPPLVVAVRVCPACAFQAPVGAAFCSRCGTALSVEAAEAAAARAAMLEGPSMPEAPAGLPPSPPPEGPPPVQGGC